jgi:hypothetical protein
MLYFMHPRQWLNECYHTDEADTRQGERQETSGSPHDVSMLALPATS